MEAYYKLYNKYKDFVDGIIPMLDNCDGKAQRRLRRKNRVKDNSRWHPSKPK